MIKTSIERISPSWAQEKLDALAKSQAEGGFIQRSPRKAAIQRYVQDMKAGKWLLTHQGIAFDEKDHLIDGQNRLWAVVRSGCTVEMLVTTGVPSNGKVTAMDVIDGGVTRSLAQAFQVSHGYGGNAQELAVLVRQLVFMVAAVKGISRPNLSTGTALFILEDLNFVAAFERLTSIITLRKVRRGPIMAPLCWYWKVHPKKAESFAQDYSSLEGLKKGSPPLALLRWFQILPTARRQRKSEVEKQSITAAAIQAYEADESVSILVPSVKVALPWLVKKNLTLFEQIIKRAIL